MTVIYLLCVVLPVVAVLFQILWRPLTLHRQWRASLKTYLFDLDYLNKDIFSCLLQPEYVDNIYLFERRIHLQKIQCLRSLHRLREVVGSIERRNTDKEYLYSSWLNQLEGLFSNMLDYSQLRRRVTDYTTFSVCSQEFAGILQAMDGLFECISSCDREKLDMQVQALKNQIYRLEENYHHVLQIASREPLPFLLFIDSLNTFCMNMEGCCRYEFTQAA